MMRPKKRSKRASKYMSLVLRHHPEAAGIELDEHGWANVDEFLAGISERYPLTMEELEEIVREDEKQRYSFSPDKKLIRANQGHSIPVDVELEKKRPPLVLWHGTGKKSVESIYRDGILPMSRLYVHLSKDIETAKSVGRRHGEPYVFRIDTERMVEDGYSFYLSANGIWLTKRVPPEYLVEEKLK